MRQSYFNRNYREEYELKLTLDEVLSLYHREIRGKRQVPSNKAMREICYYWRDIDLTKLKTKKVSRLDEMFFNEKEFNQDISNWDVSNINRIYGFARILKGCSSFNHDLSSWGVESLNLGLDYINFSHEIKLTHKIKNLNLLKINLKDAEEINIDLNEVTGMTIKYFDNMSCLPKHVYEINKPTVFTIRSGYFAYFILTKSNLYNINFEKFNELSSIYGLFDEQPHYKVVLEHIEKIKQSEKDFLTSINDIEKLFN